MTQHWIYLSIYQVFIVSNLYPHVSDVSLPAALSLQGGPHNHQIGGLAVQLLEVDSPMFKDTLDDICPTTFYRNKKRTGTGTDQTENIWKALRFFVVSFGSDVPGVRQAGGFWFFLLFHWNFEFCEIRKVLWQDLDAMWGESQCKGLGRYFDGQRSQAGIGWFGTKRATKHCETLFF